MLIKEAEVCVYRSESWEEEGWKEEAGRFWWLVVEGLGERMFGGFRQWGMRVGGLGGGNMMAALWR